MQKQRLRDTWLIRKHEAGVLALIYMAMTAVWLGFGFLLTHPLKNSFIVRNDQSVSEWFVRHRTTRLNSLSFAGSMLSDTVAKISVTAIIAILFLIIWKRWLEPLTVVVPTILEAMCFITVTWIIGRPRPDVPHLDTSPVGSSYPSGHTGAAAAYFAIVVVIFWHTRRAWIRALVATVAVIIPIIVGLARIYRGMHFLTDVIFGALLGATSVIASIIVIRRAAERYGQADPALEGWGPEDELSRASITSVPVS
jgi:membrane-associated phospholipid phosphatase